MGHLGRRTADGGALHRQAGVENPVRRASPSHQASCILGQRVWTVGGWGGPVLMGQVAQARG